MEKKIENPKSSRFTKETYDDVYKVLLLGDVAVGKSCIFLRYTENCYTENHISTIGLDFRTISLQISNENIGLQLWDTAGQEKYFSITKNYFKNSSGIAIVYDISSRSSFEKVPNWIRQIKEFSNLSELSLVLIGNKNDLTDKRQVSTEEGIELAAKYNIIFSEVSAKTGDNIQSTFEILGKKIKEYKENFSCCKCKCNCKDKKKKFNLLDSIFKLGDKKKGCCN